MKKSFMLIAVALLAFAGSASAQNSATGTGHASARIILPISVGEDYALSFGTFFSGASAGTVAITPSNVSGATGTRGTTGGVTAYTGSQGTAFHQAEWSIEGEVGFLYTITLTGPYTVTSGANSMSYSLGSPVANGTVGTIGTDPANPDTDDVMYGATLTVPAGQANGTYTGTYTLKAQYN